ncbi:GNAT family N-acetyltransferase [Flavobacterium ardleyense]|uniref:GNAT family N-acetyltransferase n=1 Tax=Flavobacterium ardleyense TaxID=2038737 RepID=UPI00298D4883|nr:GNAT family N-acetyltransferase [Flavobacterium ardleyense]
MTTFKSLEHQEIPTIVALMTDFYQIDGYPIDPNLSEKLFADFIEKPDLGRAWIIYEDQEVVGYLILAFMFSFEYGGTIAFLDELYLNEKSRGKGLGKKAVAFVQDQAAKFNLKLLYLEIEHHNSTAQKLYLAAGFELHNRNIMRYNIN